MADVPTLSQYDGKKAKVRCSIQWIISEAYKDETKISRVLPQCDIAQVFESDGGLKKSISHLLCGGEPYCRITSRLFNLVAPLQSHEDVIQTLCSKGLYVLDEEDSLITANDLRKMPLALGSHLTIIDMLMFAYLSSKLISINSLVMTVRKFSEFSASKELPDDLEQALKLWLNKISLKIQTNHRNSLESDKHTFGQQREEDSHFPCVSNLTEDLYDGRSSALLLHYYCPEHVLLRDICLKDPISIADAWNNLQVVFEFCNNIILPQNSTLRSVISPTVLHPVDLLYCGHELKLNVMLLLGTIYHYLENDPLENVVSPLGHTVLCRRQRDHSFEDISNGVTDHTAPFITSQEKHHQTLMQASQLIPGVQPLISNATRQSFRRPTPDTDSISTITLNESEGRGSPAPFSSKPLLVRRNREPHQPLLSPTSKPYMRTPVQHLPIIKNQLRQDMSDENDQASSGFHPLRKSNSHQGLSEDSRFDQTQPAVNKWQLRTSPMLDLRNTNTSNNTYIHGHDGYSTDRSTFSKTTQDANSVHTSDLLSNVEMDTESETQVSNRSRLVALGRMTPSSDFSYIPTFELRNPFTPHGGNQNRNDLILESARTSEYGSARSQPTITRESSATSDLTSVSPRTDSSNEVGSQDLTYGGTSDAYYSRDIPSLISADESPDLPRNVTRVKPYCNSDTGTSSVSAPSSQKSYTIQNGEFHTIDSARAAGYPIIETSPQNQLRPRRVMPDMQTSRSTTSDSQRSKNSMGNGSGDLGKSMPMKAKPVHNKQDEMVIGGTVVKLRSPQKKSNRIIRNAKASSWMDETDQKDLNPPSDDQQRRHSNVTSAEQIAAMFKKLDQRIPMDKKGKISQNEEKTEQEKRMDRIASVFKKSDLRRLGDMKGRRIVQKKEQIEQEKRSEGREWGKRCFQFTKEMPCSPSRRSNEHHDHRRQIVSNHMPRTVFDGKLPPKNEETSSDYSSKSPSPSSLNNAEGKESESGTKPVSRQHRNLDEISGHHNYFASPLSTTMYHVPNQTSHQQDQSLETTARSRQVVLDQHNTFDVPERGNVTQPPTVTQPRDKSHSSSASHRSAFSSPRRNTPQTQHSSSKNQSSDQTLMSSQGHSFVTPTAEKRQDLPPQNAETVLEGPKGNVTYNVPVRENLPFQQQQKKDIVDAPTRPNHNIPRHQDQNGIVGSRQMTYDVSGQFADENTNVPHMSSLSPSCGHQNEPPQVIPPSQPDVQYPDINILRPLPTEPEHATRRTLFPTAGVQDPDTSIEQENINPNHLSVGRADQTTYDSFSHKIAGIGSNQSTPHKMSPSQMQEVITPPKGDGESDMSSVLLKTADRDRKGGRGFELVDETTPNTDLAKKKEQFLLKQLKKEEELKRKRADREKLEEKRKEEARQKQDEIAAKKEEEKLKRQQILEDYKKRKMQQEEAQLIQQSSAIISGGNSKKHPKPESATHAGRIGKASRSGRSSPVPDNHPLVARTYSSPNLNSPSGENHSTFVVPGGVDKNGNMVPFRTRKQSPARKDWETESASSSAVSSDYTGPKLYKQPSAKSNKHIVYNAICHCCLPGKVNEPHRNSTIQVLEMSSEKHFMILFRDAKCQYRALYTYNPDEERLHRISGNGPHTVVPSMIEHLFKYNSGRKAFTALSSKTLSVSIDGITIKNALWQKKTSSAKK